MKRTALCVGINDYPGTGADLSGCLNDAVDWATVLHQRGYTVQVLTDASATKLKVAQALRNAVEDLRYRDRFVFTFSGHGTWVPDHDGDEIDGRDEALCCYDLYDGGLLTDDELHGIFSRARHGTQITVLSDSCHSGTVARGIIAPTPTPHMRRKFISPGEIPSVPVTIEQAVEAEARIVKVNSRLGPVLISGCADPEYSYDANFGGRPNGAFTRVAIDTLGSDVKSYREWYRRIRMVLPNNLYPQTPQLGASAFQRYRRPLS